MARNKSHRFLGTRVGRLCIGSTFNVLVVAGTRKVLPNGGRGDYEWLSYGQTDVRITNFGSGLRALGLRVGDKVGIMAINRAEWAITDFTCACFGFLSVTLYDTLGEFVVIHELTYVISELAGPDVIEFIINHSELRCVVVEPSKLPHVRTWLSFGAPVDVCARSWPFERSALCWNL